MKVQDIIQVTGRGTIFIVDLKENGYTTEKYIKEIPIKVGTNVVHDGETYIVTGVEVQSYERGYNSTIGLNVRKL